MTNDGPAQAGPLYNLVALGFRLGLCLVALDTEPLQVVVAIVPPLGQRLDVVHLFRSCTVASFTDRVPGQNLSPKLHPSAPTVGPGASVRPSSRSTVTLPQGDQASVASDPLYHLPSFLKTLDL